MDYKEYQPRSLVNISLLFVIHDSPFGIETNTRRICTLW